MRHRCAERRKRTSRTCIGKIIAIGRIEEERVSIMIVEEDGSGVM